MALIKDFEELDVYRLAFDLQQEIFQISRQFPKEERYSLTDQIRRSSRSIGANIAEAWAKRRYKPHFVSKLTDADGEQLETRHWLKTALSCGCLNAEEYERLDTQCSEIGGKLGRIMADADRWRAHF